MWQTNTILDQKQPLPPPNSLNNAANGLNMTGHMHDGMLGPFYPPKIVTRGVRKAKNVHCWPKNVCFGALLTSLGDIFWGLKGPNIRPCMCPAMFNTFSALFNLVGAAHGLIWYLLSTNDFLGTKASFF